MVIIIENNFTIVDIEDIFGIRDSFTAYMT